MQPQEILSTFLEKVFIVVPLLLGREVLANPSAMRDIIVALLVAGIAYSLPMLVEVRLSPQLNTWVYGFFQHDFGQMMRYGGFRPIVFLQHGLWVAFFAFMVSIAALALLRQEAANNRLKFFLAAVYLMTVLVLCKSAGAIIYIVCLAPAVLFLGHRTQIRIAAVLAGIVLLYPMLRGAGFIPTEAIMAQATSIDLERSLSLGFRLRNEDELLLLASERPLFGWGGWGRNLVHDEMTGRTLSVIDGRWIIAIGMWGWFGYIGDFGLLTLPLVLLAAHTWQRSFKIAAYVAALAIILAANLVDLLPNATVIPFTWLLAGALLGYTERGGGGGEQKTIVTEKAPANPAPWAKPARLPENA